MKCVVCNRTLKDQKSIEQGVGPSCKKKITPEAIEEIQKIRQEDLDAVVYGHRSLQLQIPEHENENPRKIKYPKGVKKAR